MVGRNMQCTRQRICTHAKFGKFIGKKLTRWMGSRDIIAAPLIILPL